MTEKFLGTYRKSKEKYLKIVYRKVILLFFKNSKRYFSSVLAKTLLRSFHFRKSFYGLIPVITGLLFSYTILDTSIWTCDYDRNVRILNQSQTQHHKFKQYSNICSKKPGLKYYDNNKYLILFI